MAAILGPLSWVTQGLLTSQIIDDTYRIAVAVHGLSDIAIDVD